MVEAADVVLFHEAVIGVAELENKHFELRGVRTDGVRPLVDFSEAFDDIVRAVGDKELGPKGLKKIVESRVVGIGVVVAVPGFCVFVKENGGDTGLFFCRDLREVHVFLYAKSPVGNIAEGRIGAIKYCRLRDSEARHRGCLVIDLVGLVGLVGFVVIDLVGLVGLFLDRCRLGGRGCRFVRRWNSLRLLIGDQG